MPIPKGFKHTQETIIKMKKAHKGRRHSKETREKISKAHIGKQKGNKNYFWTGGKKIGEGYIFIWKPNHPRASKARYVPEHYLIWEEYWNQIVPRDYIIHHIDGNRKNNKITNLALITRGFHNVIHKKRIEMK